MGFPPSDETVLSLHSSATPPSPDKRRRHSSLPRAQEERFEFSRRQCGTRAEAEEKIRKKDNNCHAIETLWKFIAEDRDNFSPIPTFYCKTRSGGGALLLKGGRGGSIGVSGGKIRRCHVGSRGRICYEEFVAFDRDNFFPTFYCKTRSGSALLLRGGRGGSVDVGTRFVESRVVSYPLPRRENSYEKIGGKSNNSGSAIRIWTGG